MPRSLPDGSRIDIMYPLGVKAYNESMGSVDLADQMRRFYTCTHKSSHRWYIRLFWFLIDLAIDNAFVIESFRPDGMPTPLRQVNKDFHEELATELISKFNSRQRGGRQAQNAPAWLVQRHFPVYLGTDS